MADSAIILYLKCLKGLIYHFKIIDQRDLNKKNSIKICKRLSQRDLNKRNITICKKCILNFF